MKNDIDFNKYGKNFNAKEIIVMLNTVDTFQYKGRHSRAGGNLNATYKPSQSITIIHKFPFSEAFMSTPWFPIKLGMTIPGACQTHSNIFLKKLIAQDNIFLVKQQKRQPLVASYILFY
jgi:hypothetical protein